MAECYVTHPMPIAALTLIDEDFDKSFVLNTAGGVTVTYEDICDKFEVPIGTAAVVIDMTINSVDHTSLTTVDGIELYAGTAATIVSAAATTRTIDVLLAGGNRERQSSYDFFALDISKNDPLNRRHPWGARIKARGNTNGRSVSMAGHIKVTAISFA